MIAAWVLSCHCSSALSVPPAVDADREVELVDFGEGLLAWRKRQPGYLSRTDAVKKMIERVLDEDATEDDEGGLQH